MDAGRNREPLSEVQSPRLRRIGLLGVLIVTFGFGGWLVGVSEGKRRSSATVIALDLDLKRESASHKRLTVAHQALLVRQRRTERQKAELLARLAKQRDLVRQTTASLTNKMNWAIRRNTAGALAGNVPIAGDLADAGATAYDIYEYKQMIKRLETLNSNMRAS